MTFPLEYMFSYPCLDGVQDDSLLPLAMILCFSAMLLNHSSCPLPWFCASQPVPAHHPASGFVKSSSWILPHLQSAHNVLDADMLHRGLAWASRGYQDDPSVPRVAVKLTVRDGGADPSGPPWSPELAPHLWLPGKYRCLPVLIAFLAFMWPGMRWKISDFQNFVFQASSQACPQAVSTKRACSITDKCA